MNDKLLDELADCIEMRSTPVLIRGHGLPELHEAANRHSRPIRIVGPQEFSIPIIHKLQSENRILVFHNIHDFSDAQIVALEAILKNETSFPDDRSPDCLVFATCRIRETFDARLVTTFRKIVDA